MGDWMKVNNEAIYATKSTKKFKEGDVKYTISKNNKFVYAIATKTVNGQLQLANVSVKKGSKIFMLGVERPLTYKEDSNGNLIIDWPKALPCKYAWTIKIEGTPKA
jgi:alpha-L-fucosidase